MIINTIILLLPDRPSLKTYRHKIMYPLPFVHSQEYACNWLFHFNQQIYAQHYTHFLKNQNATQRTLKSRPGKLPVLQYRKWQKFRVGQVTNDIPIQNNSFNSNYLTSLIKPVQMLGLCCFLVGYAKKSAEDKWLHNVSRAIFNHK